MGVVTAQQPTNMALYQNDPDSRYCPSTETVVVDVVGLATPRPRLPSSTSESVNSSGSSSATLPSPVTSEMGKFSLDPHHPESSRQNNKKYFCQRCVNHGEEHPRKGHKPHCKWAKCLCGDCSMVEQRRQYNNRLNPRNNKHARQEIKRASSGRKERDPKCSRCSAHGIENKLKGHKKQLCPYKDCECENCKLVEERRKLMAKQIKLRRRQQKERQSKGGGGSSAISDHQHASSNNYATKKSHQTTSGTPAFRSALNNFQQSPMQQQCSSTAAQHQQQPILSDFMPMNFHFVPPELIAFLSNLNPRIPPVNQPNFQVPNLLASQFQALQLQQLLSENQQQQQLTIFPNSLDITSNSNTSPFNNSLKFLRAGSADSSPLSLMALTNSNNGIVDISPHQSLLASIGQMEKFEELPRPSPHKVQPASIEPETIHNLQKNEMRSSILQLLNAWQTSTSTNNRQIIPAQPQTLNFEERLHYIQQLLMQTLFGNQNQHTNLGEGGGNFTPR